MLLEVLLSTNTMHCWCFAARAVFAVLCNRRRSLLSCWGKVDPAVLLA